MNDSACTENRLLEAFRRERNGLTADTMHYDGERYGVNYGVSLPTVRSIVRREAPDHARACRLLLRREREMQLAAFHLADPGRLADPSEAGRWQAAIRNTELAEEAAFALLGRVPSLPALLPSWLMADPLAAYAVMLAAVRYPSPEADWLAPMHETLQRLAADTAQPAWAARRLAEALVAFAARLADTGPTAHAAVAEWMQRLGPTPAERYVAEELAWRLDG